MALSKSKHARDEDKLILEERWKVLRSAAKRYRSTWKSSITKKPLYMSKRAEYYSALDEAHTIGDCEKFITFISNNLDRTLDLYLKLIP